VRWISCQIGAREHYAIPRALHRAGALQALVTETWLPPGHPLGTMKASLRQRFHPELRNARVVSANFANIVLELRGKFAGKNGWSLILQRNRWFQRMAARHLSRSNFGHSTSNSQVTLFAYSYAARELFRFAKGRGWRTVLGQIDPGFHEEKLVRKLFNESSGDLGDWRPAPSQYWQDWCEECELADCIVVNSEWSRQGLLAENVPGKKLHVIPLAFDETTDTTCASFSREYPKRFTVDRPLRVLFLGQINLRKGVRPLLEAVWSLKEKPIEFWFVGPIQIQVPDRFRSHAKVRWFGPVSRHATAKFYRDADIFLFPTLSDGFGLTQLEAQRWKLPVIASGYCGDVVENGHNGIRLQGVTVDSICSALTNCQRSPTLLADFAQRSITPERFSIQTLGSRLLALPEQRCVAKC
jgi:glycosyltransferase involved in cell wall biosynthesis